ncbi:MAG: hypothetical protein ACYC8T_36910 [Myxococcaceae bacterium]
MRGALPFALALAVACQPAPEPDPRPLSITPAETGDPQGVEVEISGEDFDAWVRTDFGSRRRSLLDASFSAALRPQDPAGAEVALEEVRLVSQGSLLARVPAGVEPGLYDLGVVDPGGRVGVLPGAFRVVTPAQNVARFSLSEIGEQRAHVPFTVVFRAEDAMGRPVDGFEGSVRVSDLTGTLSPTLLGPFVSGRLRVALTVKALDPADEVRAQDDLGHEGVSAPFEVRAGLPVELAIATGPQRLGAGSCSARTEVEARDRFGLPAELEAPVEVSLLSTPPGELTFFADGCTTPATTLTLGPGAARAGFHFLGSHAGPVAVRALTDALPSASQAQTIDPLGPVALVIATPPRVAAPGACSAEVVVESRDSFGNPSGPPPILVTLGASPPDGFGFFADPGCAAPVSALPLDLVTPRASFHFKGTSPGEVTVTVTSSPATLAPAVQPQTVEP